MRAAYGRSETGVVRLNNEDSIYTRSAALGRLPNIFCVADGMGGHNAGEVASSKAIEFFVTYIDASENSPLLPHDLLADAVQYANREVYLLSLRLPKAGGMGTTFSVCSVEDRLLHFAHVGDSRIYLVREGGILAVTQDHSLVAELVRSGALTEAEAREHPQRNIMTRALGTEEDLLVDKGCVPIKPGERVLLCSDGLTGMMDDAEIWEVIQQGGDEKDIVDGLIGRAIDKGGFDNVSVVFVV